MLVGLVVWLLSMRRTEGRRRGRLRPAGRRRMERRKEEDEEERWLD